MINFGRITVENQVLLKLSLVCAMFSLVGFDANTVTWIDLKPTLSSNYSFHLVKSPSPYPVTAPLLIYDRSASSPPFCATLSIESCIEHTLSYLPECYCLTFRCGAPLLQYFRVKWFLGNGCTTASI